MQNSRSPFKSIIRRILHWGEFVNKKKKRKRYTRINPPARVPSQAVSGSGNFHANEKHGLRISRGSPCMRAAVAARPKTGNGGGNAEMVRKGRRRRRIRIGDGNSWRTMGVSFYNRIRVHPFIQPLHNCHTDAAHSCAPGPSWRNGRRPPCYRPSNHASSSMRAFVPY